MKLNQEEIKKIMPHRDPMLLVDSVEEMVPLESIVTKFYVSPERDIFKGHFPGNPVLPGVYSVECMAQSFNIMMLYEGKYVGKTPLFIGINNVRFRKPIKPGDTMEVHVKLLSEREDKAIVTGGAEVYTDGDLAASGEVSIAMR